MKQVLIRQGQVIIEEVPAPQVGPGKVLVRADYSCISIGTEVGGLKSSKYPLWKKALKKPAEIQKVLRMTATKGISYTRSFIAAKIGTWYPTGYSASGVALEVGEGVTDIKPGDRVACSGSGWANHAEIICVPRNLIALIPDNLETDQACTVTLGTIALQGIRRAQPTLGETFVVIGLGVLGQITAQLLKTNGCRVFGMDLDKKRVILASELGMDYGINPEEHNAVEQVYRLTGGIGADGVIITAAASSDEVVSTAFKMCRKKGRVILVGDVGLNLKRADFYEKEIDFLISSSYGPGRYDPVYEEQGLDYPVGYVRWTENRNMMEYLNLLSQGKIQIKPLIHGIYPVEQAPTAYDNIQNNVKKPVMVLISYPHSREFEKLARKVINPAAKPSLSGRIRIAIAGAGYFAKTVHLPNILSLPNDFYIQAVMSRTGQNALAAAKQFSAKYAATDFEEILNDKEVDAVLIAARHNLHAEMVLAALKAGKHVLVEKPLALNQEDLNQIKEFYSSKQSSYPVLLTGFNRRFSCHIERIYQLIKNRTNPMVLNYRVNAGYVPPDNWVFSEEGGGRNKGEACHIYDLLTYLTGSKVKTVYAQVITPETRYYNPKDNFVTTLKFEDGSIATLTYTALGAVDYPKEQMEIFVDGSVITLKDYKELVVTGEKIIKFETKIQEKGFKKEVESFAGVIHQGGEWPIPLWQQIQATEIALTVEKDLETNG